MDKVGTGGQLWPLKSASGETPTLSASQPVTFQLNDVPDRCPTGPLAYFLTAVLLTVSGTLTQVESGGSVVSREKLLASIIDSIDWTNAFFGAPLSKNFVKGSFLQIVEFVAGGFRYGQRHFNDIGAGAGATHFSLTVALPACNDKRGRLIRDTSQLALLFQPSQLKLNPTDLVTAIQTVSAGATLTGMTCRASAVLVPRQEIVLGTPLEWVLHEIAKGGSSVKITGYGRDTALTGVEAKGGVAFLAELTNYFLQGGCVQPNAIDSAMFQWRGQGQINDINGFVDMVMGALPNDRPNMTALGASGTANTTNDYQGFPYVEDTEDTVTATLDVDSSNVSGIRFFPWVLGADGLELTELQTAQTDETYYLNGAGAFANGSTHEIVAQYARQWQPNKIADFVSLVMQGGPNSLAAYVLGNGYASAKPSQRLPRTKHTLSPDQRTYLPWQVV